jgi:pimeloyl-ACP methyl ester carboxylesterase
MLAVRRGALPVLVGDLIAVVVVPILVLALLWCHLRFWRRRLEVPHEYLSTERVALPDGGVMELRRAVSSHTHAPQASERVPVLLTHGLAMNHRCVDLSHDRSLASELLRDGRDVWLLTTRSGGERWSLRGGSHNHFAAMVEHDFPQAIERVLQITGHKQLDIAGFSMGGMLVYASVARTVPAERIRRVVFMACPGIIPPLGVLNLSRFLPVQLTPAVPLRLWMRTLAFAPSLVPAVLRRFLYNPDNFEPMMERRMMWHAWADISGPLGRDFIGWSVRGSFSVRDHDVLSGLSRISVPALFFAGGADQLAPVASVKAAFEAWGSEVEVEKTLLVLQRGEHGVEIDYGHCDLVMGRGVVRDVFEPVRKFLSAGDSVRQQPSEPLAAAPSAA